MYNVRLTTAQAEGLEAAVEEHMVYCSYEINGLEDEIPESWEPFGPFCGCQTCESREFLMATFDYLRKQGIVDVYIRDIDENTLFD